MITQEYSAPDMTELKAKIAELKTKIDTPTHLHTEMDTDALESYTKTLGLDLMQIKTRYVIMSAKGGMASPAGVSPSSLVMIVPEGQIFFTDTVPTGKDATPFGGMYLHDTEKF